MADRWRRMLPGLWAGMLICIAAIAAPAAFGALPNADAGQVVARIFVREGWLSLGLAAVLLWLQRRPGGMAAAGPKVGNAALLWTTAVCTLLGYFAVQALMPAARTGQGVLSFAQLHLISTAFYGIKTLAVLLLAWRATGVSRPPSF
jgi:uncharacterized membrane protein (DUF441 family)